MTRKKKWMDKRGAKVLVTDKNIITVKPRVFKGPVPPASSTLPKGKLPVGVRSKKLSAKKVMARMVTGGVALKKGKVKKMVPLKTKPTAKLKKLNKRTILPKSPTRRKVRKFKRLIKKL